MTTTDETITGLCIEIAELREELDRVSGGYEARVDARIKSRHLQRAELERLRAELRSLRDERSELRAQCDQLNVRIAVERALRRQLREQLDEALDEARRIPQNGRDTPRADAKAASHTDECNYVASCDDVLDATIHPAEDDNRSGRFAVFTHGAAVCVAEAGDYAAAARLARDTPGAWVAVETRRWMPLDGSPN